MIILVLLAMAFRLSSGFRSSIISVKVVKSSILFRSISIRSTALGAAVFKDSMDGSSFHPIKVAYQGEPGAYSEKASKELLGPRIMTVNYPSFEDTFKAVANKDVDYAVVPIENSLGGSIHTNYDLLLRYDLNIIAEHEFRVEHFLMAQPGVQKKDIKKVLSHPQALAQCDNYLTALGVIKEATYDTAGSAKMIRDKGLTNCAAIASDLAAATYGLEILDKNIEDHDINFTRFLLLSRQAVSSLLPPNLPAKTSIVFVPPDSPGALYKALSCFSLRDIDCCKIESRPTSVQLLQYLQLRDKMNPSKSSKTVKDTFPMSRSSTNSPEYEKSSQDLPRFRYTFYLDFLASEFDDRAQNALHHLREQSTYLRVLGSFPVGGKLLGPIKQSIDTLAKVPMLDQHSTKTVVEEEGSKKSPLKIGIVGFGKFGQFLAKTFTKDHMVYCMDKDDMSATAKSIGCEFFPLYDMTAFAKADLDVILFSVSIISFEEVIRLFPKDIFKGKLVVDVLSVKVSEHL
jgi:prephenate dehydratase